MGNLVKIFSFLACGIIIFLLGITTGFWTNGKRAPLETLAPSTHTSSIYKEFHGGGLEDIASNIRKVTDIKQIDRSPLFNNAPFLRLKKDDTFVKARQWLENGKGVAPDFAKEYSFFLCSEGQYYLIWTRENDNQLILLSACDCLLFDWEVTIENAEALKNIYNQWKHEMTYKEYKTISMAIEKEFPNVFPPDFNLGNASAFGPPKLVSISRNSHVVFQGIAYDDYSNYIYKYTLKIGPAIFLSLREKLAEGPKHIDRWEFEGSQPRPEIPNSMPPFDVPPEIAKKKKQEYDAMVRFQKLVLDITDKKSNANHALQGTR